MMRILLISACILLARVRYYLGQLILKLGQMILLCLAALVVLAITGLIVYWAITYWVLSEG